MCVGEGWNVCVGLGMWEGVCVGEDEGECDGCVVCVVGCSSKGKV